MTRRLPPGLQPVAAAVTHNKLPRPVGMVSTLNAPKDAVEDLQKILPGFKKGDSIPEDLPDWIHQAKLDFVKQAKEEAASRTVVDPRSKPIPEPDEVPIEKLSPEARKSLADYIQKADVIFKQNQHWAKETKGVQDPSVAQAIRAAHEEYGVPEVTKPIKEYQAPAPEAKAPEPPKEEEKPEEKKEPEIEVSDEDKRKYIISLKPGAPRFTKEYSLFGGAVTVEFRRLSRAESQAALDRANLDLPDLASYLPQFVVTKLMSRMMDYNLALSLVRIEHRDDGGFDFPVLAEHPFSKVGHPDYEDRVRKVYDVVFDQVLEDNVLVSAVQGSFREFTQLQNALIEHAKDPDFFVGIG